MAIASTLQGVQGLQLPLSVPGRDARNSGERPDSTNEGGDDGVLVSSCVRNRYVSEGQLQVKGSVEIATEAYQSRRDLPNQSLPPRFLVE